MYRIYNTNGKAHNSRSRRASRAGKEPKTEIQAIDKASHIETVHQN
jgi:hypothetical protein